MFATAATLGSGGSGGLFGPSLYIGCMFGGAMGYIFQGLFPSIVTFPIHYCLIGMSCLFVAAAQAPINTPIMIAEMTDNFRLIPPLFVASTVSYIIARLLFKGSSLYTLNLERQGIKFKSTTIYELETLRIQEIMESNLETVTSGSSLLEFIDLHQDSPKNQFPVVDHGELKGIFHVNDIIQIPSDEWEQKQIKDVMDTQFHVISLIDPAQKAIDIMYEYDLKALMVVEKRVVKSGCEAVNKLKGIITIKDILRYLDQNQKPIVDEKID
jgi:chloride channel protein, CIC family